MPRIVTPLTDTQLKALKPQDKAYIKSDGGGLRILVKPNGVNLWEYEYTSPTLKKRRKTSFGNYPQTTLVNARSKRDQHINLIRQGIDPLERKQSEKAEQKASDEVQSNTFIEIASKWHDNYKIHISENQHYKIWRSLELHVFPSIGSSPITIVTRKDIVAILKTLKENGTLETANRIFSNLNRIYKYAVTLEYTPHNIIADIDKQVILGKRGVTHYPTFTKTKDIRGVLLSIDEYKGELSTTYALKLLPYLFVRSSNIRNMSWDEIDFDKQEWTIPAHKMKVKKEFILPLPHQVIAILKEYKDLGIDNNRVIFNGIRSDNKPISDNTLISALRRMGYTKEQLVPHSFRSIFSTIAYENMGDHGHSGEVIEALLAHKETNKVKDAYNRATYKEPMKGLMQWYANYLDKVKQ